MITKTRARQLVREMRVNLRYIEAEIKFGAHESPEAFEESNLHERLNEIDGDSALLREFFEGRED